MSHAFHYKELIQNELQRRTERNPSYSLRSFARDISISPSQVSKIIHGKQTLSLESAKGLVNVLCKREEESHLFLSLVEANNRNKTAEPTREELFLFSKLTGNDDFRLDEQEVKYFYTWAMFSVFEVLSLKNAPRNVEEIAARLNITLEETERSLAHLLETGLIRLEGSRIVRTHREFKTTNGISSQAIRDLHKQFIGKALHSVENLPIERRHLRGYTTSLKKEYLPKVKELMEKFIHEVAQLEFQSEGEATELYQINLQFFDLLNNKENEDHEAE